MRAEPLTVAWTSHDKYFALVVKNYARIEALKKEHDEFQSSLKGKKMSDRDMDILASKNDAIGELALVVVVFSALTLEAYINHYGISRLSRNYFAKYLDKLDMVAKWIVIPKVVTGKQLDPGSTAMQDLDWLVALRNRLVHYKSKRVAIDNIQTSDFLWYEDAARALQAVRRITSALKGLDPEAELDWLERK
jgi:hypothetical protein